jgi:hypothetical protein
LFYARIKGSNKDIEATHETRRRNDYRCPVCGKPVSLRKGDVYAPYFAHRAGATPAQCELYRPGHGGGGGSSGGAILQPVRSVLEADLILDVADTWTLLLKVPELTSDDVRQTTASKLEDARIEARDDSGKVIGRLSLLELLPGTSRARIPVRPTTTPLSMQPRGEWPSHIEKARWSVPTPGLKPNWTFFREYHGEWVRARQGEELEWGEALCALVPHDRLMPPRECAPRAIKGSGGGAWSCWALTLPQVHTSTVARWLEGLGHEVRPPSWKFASVTPFLGFDGEKRQYVTGIPLVVRVTAPAPRSQSMVLLTYGDNELATDVECPQDSTYAHALVTVSQPGENQLEIADADGELVFETVPQPKVDDLRREIAEIPRLTVQVNGAVAEAWGKRIDLDRSTSNLAEWDRVPVTVDFSDKIPDARCAVRWGKDGAWEAQQDLTASRAAGLIASVLSSAEAIRLIVDAGALGCVEVDASAIPTKLEGHEGLDRVSRWLVIRAARARCGTDTYGAEPFAARVLARACDAGGVLSAARVDGASRQLLRAAARKIQRRA